jgi:pyruvate dehydrogenase E2 component (dihydrolipoamide acetyltransferase)
LQATFDSHYHPFTDPPHTKLNFPALSPTMLKGNLISWAKKEGDEIKPGDMLGEIETDKSVMAFEASEAEGGFLARILIQAGAQNLPVGKDIAIIVEKKEDVAAFKDFTDVPAASATAPAPAAPAPSAPATPSSSAPAPFTSSAPAGGRIFASPLARATAAASGVDLAELSGTGPNGRIVKADVVGASKPRAAQPTSFAASIPPVTTASYTDIPNSNIRKVIASRLTASKQTIPHYYLTIEANVDALLKIRADLNAKANGAYKLSVNDFIVKASAAALRKVMCYLLSNSSSSIFTLILCAILPLALFFLFIHPISLLFSSKGS